MKTGRALWWIPLVLSVVLAMVALDPRDAQATSDH
jgi:hypothetical protein